MTHFLQARKTGRLLFFIGMLAIGLPASAGMIPPWEQVFTFQGQLKNNGTPYSGSVPMEFSLWSAASGGSQVGSAWQENVQVQNGLFVAEVYIPSATWNDQRYLQVSVDGETLGSRQRINPTPTSMLAFETNNGGNSGPWTVNGNDIHYLSGRVGIGREPGTMLDVNALPGFSPLRVAVAGTTRLSMGPGGGLSVGSAVAAPDTGIRIQGPSVLNGIATLASLGTAGGNSLCRNGSNQIAQCSSSARYKDDIVDLEPMAGVLKALRPVSYRWIDSGEEDLGLVAEEVALIEPRLVTRNAAGDIEGVKYERLSAILLAVLQEQLVRLDQRDAELAELRSELDDLRGQTAQRLALLEALLMSGPELAQGARQ